MGFESSGGGWVCRERDSPRTRYEYEGVRLRAQVFLFLVSLCCLLSVIVLGVINVEIDAAHCWVANIFLTVHVCVCLVCIRTYACRSNLLPVSLKYRFCLCIWLPSVCFLRRECALQVPLLQFASENVMVVDVPTGSRTHPHKIRTHACRPASSFVA